MTVIVGCVVAAHAVALWALQAGLLRKAAEVIVPVQVLSDFITPAPPPAPVPTPPTPAPTPPKPKAPPPPAPVR
ncbi:MAG: energy transducer TonB, partial [Comamonas sp.]